MSNQREELYWTMYKVWTKSKAYFSRVSCEMSPFYCHLYFVNKISYFILAHNNLINEQHHLYKFYKEYPTNPIQIQSPNHEKKKEMVLFVPVI